MKKFFSALLIASFCLGVDPLVAGEERGDCSSFYVGGTAPVFSNTKMQKGLRELCYEQFAVLHSALTKTPLVVSQYLTRQMVKDGASVEREDVFHEEKRLPEAERATSGDYKRSGFDRGHMAPAADMASVRAQNESFSLANMVPQIPELNRHGWADIEQQVRDNVFKYGEAYISTGVIYKNKKLRSIGRGVIVPDATFKIAYYPSKNAVEAWIGDNLTGKVSSSSLSEVAAVSGIYSFPTLMSSDGKISGVPQKETDSFKKSIFEEFFPEYANWLYVVAFVVLVVYGRHWSRKK